MDSVLTPDGQGFLGDRLFLRTRAHRTLNIPVGLISADWGGTVCESWTSEEGLKSFPEFTPDLDFMHSSSATNTDAKVAWKQAMEPWWDAVEKKDPGSVEQWYSPMLDDKVWASFQAPGPVGRRSERL
jgi:sialate O-acetylesterase